MTLSNDIRSAIVFDVLQRYKPCPLALDCETSIKCKLCQGFCFFAILLCEIVQSSVSALHVIKQDRFRLFSILLRTGLSTATRELEKVRIDHEQWHKTLSECDQRMSAKSEDHRLCEAAAVSRWLQYLLSLLPGARRIYHLDAPWYSDPT